MSNSERIHFKIHITSSILTTYFVVFSQFFSALLEFNTVENIGSGYFDLGIRYAGKGQGKFKPNTFFPIEQQFKMQLE